MDQKPQSSTAIEAARQRLSQAKALSLLMQDLPLTEMLTVYLSDVEESHNLGIHCALIPSNKIESYLVEPDWDFSHGDGVPGAIVYHEGHVERVEYHRYGGDGGLEPLVLNRRFHDLRPDYNEICEEFRLFHNLFHERKNDEYFKIFDSGKEQKVAIVSQDHVQIRLMEIRQFLSIKEMHLSVQLDFKVYSRYSLEEIGVKEDSGSEHRESLACWMLRYGDFSIGLDGYRAFSRLLGKRLIPPLPKSKSGLWGFAETPNKKYANFIVGVDENGDPILSNENRPDFLTPVYFRKQVLDKYYQEPGKYLVEDSILHCGSLWSVYIDNHHDDKVCAWLGDLERDLPYEEQLHWRAHNIPPEGGMSATYLKRQLLAQHTDSDRPEHIFRQRYEELKAACEEYLGWQLLLPLTAGDTHHFRCMRVPATDEQRDFDELILGLTKILIDSINEQGLNSLIPSDRRTDLRGSIARLEVAFASYGVQGAADPISFLRRLQNLRSSSAAHRKGSNYRKIAAELGLEDQSLREVFAGILRQAVDVIGFLTTVVRSGKISQSTPPSSSSSK